MEPMAVKCECWKSTSGKIHDTEHAALRDDLHAWLTAHGVPNEGVANQIIAGLTTDLAAMTEFRCMIDRMQETHPDHGKTV